MALLDGHGYDVRAGEEVQAVELELEGAVHLLHQPVGLLEVLQTLEGVAEHEVVAGPEHAGVMDDPGGLDDVLVGLVAMEHILADVGRAGLDAHDHLGEAHALELAQHLLVHHLGVGPDGEGQVDVLFVLLHKLVHPAREVGKDLVVEVDKYQLFADLFGDF